MKIQVNLTSGWSPCKNPKYKFAKAVYLDVDACNKVYGIVVTKSDSSVEAPQNSVSVVLRQWGFEEYNGHKNLKFMGAF